MIKLIQNITIYHRNAKIYCFSCLTGHRLEVAEHYKIHGISSQFILKEENLLKLGLKDISDEIRFLKIIRRKEMENNKQKIDPLCMKPNEFRKLVREEKWTDITIEACQGYAQANLAILPKEYAYDFLLFCTRNPRPCPILEVTEPGDPCSKELAVEADIRTDLPRYRIFKNGEIIDEPTNIIEYWRDDLVTFFLGCSISFLWALKSANVSWKNYGNYKTSIKSKPAGFFHGPIVVTVRSFKTTHEATRAIQISSGHLLMHGSPIYIGKPEDIGIELGKLDLFNPKRFEDDPPRDNEIIMYWACGITPQAVAIETKIPLMITHYPANMFVTDHIIEEFSNL